MKALLLLPLLLLMPLVSVYSLPVCGPACLPVQTEMVVHAFASGCAPMTDGVPTMIMRMDNTPLPVGRDAWKIGEVISDSAHNRTLLTTITTINGEHNLTETIWQGSSVVSNVSIPVSDNITNPGDFTGQEFVDLYFTPNQLDQFEWYSPHAATIMVNMNILLWGFTPTDIAVAFMPIHAGDPIQFQPFNDTILVGNDVGNQTVMGAFNSSPCATPMSLALTNNINTNACEDAFVSTGISLNAEMTTK